MKLASRRLTRGFTLIEILVVVNIIALLMLLLTGVLPRIGARVKIGRAAQCAHNRRIIEEAEAFYVQQHNGEHSASLEALVEENYLTALPQCSSGGEYVWLTDDQEPTLGCSVHYADLAIPLSSILFQSLFDALDNLKILQGKWNIKDGWLIPTTSTSENKIFLGDDSWGDQEIRLTAVFNQGTGYGLYYRADGNANAMDGYLFAYYGSSKRFYVYKVVDGKQTILQNVNMTKIMPSGFTISGVPHDIRIVATGDHQTVYVDNIQIMDFKDSTYSAGQVGLRGWNKSDVAFDQIQVIKP